MLGDLYQSEQYARVAEFDFSRRPSTVDIKLLLTQFYFHLSAIFITLRPNCDLLHQCTKFPLQSVLSSFTKESPLITNKLLNMTV